MGSEDYALNLRFCTKEKLMQHKRSCVSVNESTFVSLRPKRLKIDACEKPFSSKEKKARVNESISALQQLVSPYGKTDTASVLLEAMEYITFLHEQVKVLSAPYLYSTQTQLEDSCSLQARGLCLVPTSFSLGVAGSNGADMWAPIKVGPSYSRRLVSDEGSVVTYS